MDFTILKQGFKVLVTEHRVESEILFVTYSERISLLSVSMHLCCYTVKSIMKE